ncbi:hypothetical protein LINPERHAP2_LOCUS32187, partial [Linum perenne]
STKALINCKMEMAGEPPLTGKGDKNPVPANNDGKNATKKERVELKDLKFRLDHENDLEKWCQMYVLYLTGTLICTTPYQHANMKYAGILRRNCLANLVDYNWCGHVLKHMHEGFVEAQTKKYLNVDLHLIMVCICEKFGSRANRPKPIILLCGEWETTDARKEWKAIEAKGSNFISVWNKIKFPEFGPETKVNLEGLTYVELVRLEQWILSIKINCEANLSALREHVRAKQSNSAHPRETSIPNAGSISRDMEEVVDEGTSMVTVCLQCGGNGFAVAFVRCRGCKLHVIHRYCLHPMPGFKELVLWYCEDCEPKFERLSQSKKHPISFKGSDYATLQKVPSLEKESVPTLTMQRLEINSSLPNGVVPSSTNSTEDVEEARKKRLKRDEEGKDSLCDVQPLGVSSCMSGEKDKVLRSCNGFEKDVIVEQAELSTGKEFDEISDSDEKRQGHKELKIDAQNEAPLRNSQPPEAGCRKVGEKDKGFRRCNSIQEEAMVEHAEPLTSEKHFEICDTNGKHERQKRLKKDEEYEGSLCDLPSLEVNICKDGEQDKGLGKRNHMHEEEMVEQTECLTAEDCLETFEASPRGSEPLEVNSCNAGEQGEELRRCNNMEETMVERSEPLRSKDSPVVDCEMPLQTLPCEDTEIEHAVQNERNEGNQCNEPDRNNSVDNQPVVPDAPVELMHTVCALPIKDPSWRQGLNSLPFPSQNFLIDFVCKNEKIYNKLVQRMINQDLGIKSVLEDAELLIFASTMLPAEYRKFQEKEYLWGVFRAKQPSNVACHISNQKCHPETPNTNTPSPVSPLS